MTKTRSRARRLHAVALLVSAALLTGCNVSTQSPPEHDDRLRKAAGVSRVSLLCAKDLWEATKPTADEIDAKISKVTGDRARHGLVRVTLSGPQLVDYLKELDSNAHPGWNGIESKEATSKRVYDALAPAVDRIKNARSVDDPAPEVIIDDTIEKSSG